MYILVAVVRVEDVVQSSLLVVEWCTVSYANQVTRHLQNRVELRLAPRAFDALGYGAADTIFVTLIAIARVEHIVQTVVLDDAGTFVYTSQSLLPTLCRGDADGCGLGLHGLEVALELYRADFERTTYTNIEHIWRAIIVDE